MPNPNYTAVMFVLDVSGSMSESHDGRRHKYQIMQDAMHKMLEQQARKLAGYITVDVTYFDDVAYEGEFDADPMTVNLSLWAGGGTQLFDSTAALVDNFEKRIKAKPADEQPGHVVVVVMTDGQSYGPQTDNGRRLPSTVQRLKGEGWDFAYLAADTSSHHGALAQLGISADCMVSENPNDKGIQIMADKLGEFISMSRSNERGHF